MFDPKRHQLEIRLMAVRRWEDELGKIDYDPNPVRKALHRCEALEQIALAWDALMEDLLDG